MQKFSILFLMFFSLLIFVKNAQAKVLPQAIGGGQRTIPRTTGTGINVSPKLRADRRALVVNFGSLQTAKSVSYALTYRTSIQEEGAIGSLNLNGLTNTSVELLFGTCSKGVCRYHTGIKNARLEVTYTSLSGKKSVKRFKIKV